jgi:hypothetical protein
VRTGKLGDRERSWRFCDALRGKWGAVRTLVDHRARHGDRLESSGGRNALFGETNCIDMTCIDVRPRRAAFVDTGPSGAQSLKRSRGSFSKFVVPKFVVPIFIAGICSSRRHSNRTAL